VSTELPTKPGQRKCSRKGCGNIATRCQGDGTFYCIKHHRFKRMRKCSASRSLKTPSFLELDTMLKNVSDMICPTCGSGMNWNAPHQGARGSVISLQHWDNGKMSFICCRCNNKHGRSKLGDDFFKLKPSEKFCPDCEQIKNRNDFYRDSSSPDGRDVRCKLCHKIMDQKRNKKRCAI